MRYQAERTQYVPAIGQYDGTYEILDVSRPGETREQFVARMKARTWEDLTRPCWRETQEEAQERARATDHPPRFTVSQIDDENAEAMAFCLAEGGPDDC